MLLQNSIAASAISIYPKRDCHVDELFVSE